MPKRRDQRGVRVNPLIASMTGRVVDTFLRKGYHKPGPEPVDPPGPGPDPPPPITCPCNMFKIADYAYSQMSIADRLPWRQALKKRKMSGYDLWMKECLVALMSTGYFPACPSVSGGFACHELVLSELRPTPENTIGLAPEPIPPFVCDFSDDFTDPDSEEFPWPQLAYRTGWYAPWVQPAGWHIKNHQARYNYQGHTHTCSHDLPVECGTDLVVGADMKPCTGGLERLELSICGIPEHPTGWHFKVQRYNPWMGRPGYHAVTLYFRAVELDHIHVFNSAGFHHYTLFKVGAFASVTCDYNHILSGHAEDVPGGYINSIDCRAYQAYGALIDNYELYAV